MKINTHTGRKSFNILTTHLLHRRCLYTPGSLSDVFNSYPDRNSDTNLPHVGLFGIPVLKSERGFQDLKEKCIVTTGALIEEATSPYRTRHMVNLFDEMSDRLCQVADLAEFIRMAHPNPDYAAAAEDASMTVQCLVETLNTNHELYSVLRDVVHKGDKFPTTPVQDHVCRLFLFDFEQCGIHLSGNERTRVVDLHYQISQLGQMFVNESNNPRVVKKQIIAPKLRHLFNIEGDNLTVTSLQTDSSEAVAREMSYRIFLRPDNEQDQVLVELLQARFELAQICGFPTYAHRALKGSTMEQPEAVMEFLNVLSEQLRSRAEYDFGIMRDMNNKSLAIWDVLYSTVKAKKSWFNVENSEFSPYFSLGSCMEGLNFLFERLYGINLKPEPIKPGECWSDAVHKLGVVHEQEGTLGYIYCDFFERPGKHNQDCHFTIRGGKLLEDGTYQLPIVVLMLNLLPPRWNNPTLLSPYTVDYLFHEMGHAMHSMLARTTYQHVSGTRCATDFAEVPSVLMEYFARDPRVLKTFACHFQTKQPIPDEMLRRLCASKNLFTASEMQLQVFYSALDQIYHGHHPLGKSTTDVLAQVQSKYYSLPYVENTAYQLRFSHLVSYGAKYYSYLVSKALASWIWQTYFAADPLNRNQGELYRRGCLQHGGGKPPRMLVKDFLQRQPTAAVLAHTLIKEIDGEQQDMTQIKV